MNEQSNICQQSLPAAFIIGNISCLVPLLTLTDDKRGKTSRPVVRAQIQTSCNSEENISNFNCFVVGVHCRFSNVLLR